MEQNAQSHVVTCIGQHTLFFSPFVLGKIIPFFGFPHQRQLQIKMIASVSFQSFLK